MCIFKVLCFALNLSGRSNLWIKRRFLWVKQKSLLLIRAPEHPRWSPTVTTDQSLEVSSTWNISI